MRFIYIYKHIDVMKKFVLEWINSGLYAMLDMFIQIATDYVFNNKFFKDIYYCENPGTRKSSF